MLEKLATAPKDAADCWRATAAAEDLNTRCIILLLYCDVR
jgi:hypothetical protein